MPNAFINTAHSGQGPKLLMIHGSVGRIEELAPFQTALSSNYSVTSFDRPGYGRSPRIPFKHFQEEVDLIRERFLSGSDKVILCGHSYGASLAFALAAAYPERVSKLVLLSLPSFDLCKIKHIYRWHIWLGRLGDNAISTSHFAQKGFSLVAPLFAKELIKTLFAPEYLRSHPLVELQSYVQRPMVLMTATIEVSRLQRAAAAMQGYMAQVKCPVLVVNGEKEDPAYHEHTAFLSRAMPNLVKVIVPETGHSSHIEKADETAARMTEFLQKAAVPI